MEISLQRIRPQQGFTLIEVMIVVVIVGILLAVALPSYQEALRKGRRADGIDKLLELANRQEQFMLDRSTYTANLADLGYDAPFVSDEGHYSMTVAACAGGSIDRCYTLTATPTGTSPQNGDERCFAFTLDSTGAKTVAEEDGSDAAANNCW